jgi:hypothetical protein
MKYILKRFESTDYHGKLVGFEVTIPQGPTRYFEVGVGLPEGQNFSDNEICYLAYKGLKESIDKWVKQEQNGERQSISLGSEFIPPDEP